MMPRVTGSDQIHVLPDYASATLHRVLQDAFREIPFYRHLFEQREISPQDDPITILDRLPVVDAHAYLDLQRDIFTRLRARPFLTEHTSGTTGQRKIRFTTAQDEAAEEELCMRFFRQCGLGPGDRVLALDIDSPDIYLFYGRVLRRLGLEMFTYVSVPANRSQSLLSAMWSRPTVLISVPSVLARCYEVLVHAQRRHSSRHLQKVVYIGEAMNSPLRHAFEEELGMELFSLYGSTEIGSVAGECGAHDGLHIYNDKVIPTIVSPKHEDGKIIGKVAWTTLHFRDQPLIKYSTGDVISISRSRCSCGSTFPSMVWLDRDQSQFVVYGHKFQYEAFRKAIERRLGALAFFLIEVESVCGRDIVTFVLPNTVRAFEYEIASALRQTDEIEYFERLKLLEWRVQYRAARSVILRKQRRVIDRRQNGGPAVAGRPDMAPANQAEVQAEVSG